MILAVFVMLVSVCECVFLFYFFSPLVSVIAFMMPCCVFSEVTVRTF